MNSEHIKIERLISCTKDERNDVKKLIAQLSSRAELTDDEIDAVVDDRNTNVFVARDGKRIVGIGLLVITRIFAERRARIEDMVVDEEYRGRGIGTQLTEFLLLAARGKGLESVEFSSRPSRKAANSLYKKMGFEQKDTNVYRIEL